MKSLLLASILFFLVSCSPSKKELYNLTDTFVESLQTNYQSYGILNAKE